MDRIFKGQVEGDRGGTLKVLFVNPSWGSLISKKGGRFNRAWPPLDLLNCGALLEREGIGVEVMDARASNFSADEIAQRAKDFDKVFITSSPIDRWQCPNLDLENFFSMLQPLPKNNLYIMGVHGTLYPEMVLEKSGACALIRGEPEMTVLELCKTGNITAVKGITYKKDGQIVSNENRLSLNMSDLPIPAYHLIDINKYEYELLGGRLALLEASRGCPFPCIYCLHEMYGGRRYRKKPMQNILAEIDYIVRTAGAESLYFIDLEFTLDKDFVHQICDHIIEKGYTLSWCCQTRADAVNLELLKKMKKAGCHLIHYGVETGSEKVMATIDKNIKLSQIEEGISLTKRAGIETACFFIFGFPGETDADREATIQFAKMLNPTYASFHIASPYPGTKLYKMSGSRELFPEAYTREHSQKALEEKVRRAYKMFYIRPAYILSRVVNGSPAIWRKQLKLFKGFIK